MAHAGGRPTTYKAEYCDRIREWGKLGKTPAYFASQLNTCKQTIHNWANEHPEFMDALRDAKGFAEAQWLDIAQNNAVSGVGSPATIKFILSAAFGMRESSEQTTTIQGPDGGPVQHSIGVKFVD